MDPQFRKITNETQVQSLLLTYFFPTLYISSGMIIRLFWSLVLFSSSPESETSYRRSVKYFKICFLESHWSFLWFFTQSKKRNFFEELLSSPKQQCQIWCQALHMLSLLGFLHRYWPLLIRNTAGLTVLNADHYYFLQAQIVQQLPLTAELILCCLHVSSFNHYDYPSWPLWMSV